MTEQEQRIAIAEFCGWVWYRIPNPRREDRVYRMLAHPEIHEYPDQSREWLVRADGTESICSWEYMEREGHVPDYLHDLNAMHEAEERLIQPERVGSSGYMNHLWNVCLRTAGPRMCTWHTAHATAAQRAEALLRCIGRWKD